MRVALRDGGGDGGGGIGDGDEGRDGDGCRLHSNSNGHGIESLLPCSSSPVPHPLKEKRAILPRRAEVVSHSQQRSLSLRLACRRRVYPGWRVPGLLDSNKNLAKSHAGYVSSLKKNAWGETSLRYGAPSSEQT